MRARAARSVAAGLVAVCTAAPAAGQLRPSAATAVIESAAIGPDERTLAVGLRGQTALVDLARRVETRRLVGGDGLLRVGFVPGGGLVTMGWADTQARLWDTAQGTTRQTALGGFQCAQFFSVAWGCRDDAHGYRVSYAPSVFPRRVALERWDAGASTTVVTVDDRAMYGAQAYAVTPDGVFAVGGRGGYSSTQTDSMPAHRDVGDGGARMYFMQQSPRYVDGGYVRVWDRTGRRVCEWTGLGRSIRALAMARNDPTILAGDEGGELFVLSRADCRLVRTLGARGGSAVAGVAVTRDGATGVGASEDGVVRFWDLAHGRALGALTLAPASSRGPAARGADGG